MSATLSSTHSPWIPLAPLRSPGAMVALKAGMLCLPSDDAAGVATFALHTSTDAVLAVTAADLGVEIGPGAAQPTASLSSPTAVAAAAASSAAASAGVSAAEAPPSPAPAPATPAYGGAATSPLRGSLRGSTASVSSPTTAPSPAPSAAALPPAIRAKAFFLMRARGCRSATCDVPHCLGAGPLPSTPQKEIMREAVPLVRNKANVPCPRIVAKLQGN